MMITGDLRTILRIMIFVIAAFLFNKFALRPYVLEHHFPEFVNIFVLSFPNLCEAILGTLLLTNIGLVFTTKFLHADTKIKGAVLYSIVVLVAAVYVILQELKIHNLGGRNVYDPFDVLFSIIGLIITYLFLLSFKPQFEMQN